MEIGGLLAQALKVVFGNPDVLVFVASFSFIFSFCLIAFEIYQYMR